MTRLLTVLSAAVLLLMVGWGHQTPSTEAAVNQIFTDQVCSTTRPGTVTVTFSWTGNHPSALQQWLDLSIQNNGWIWGTYSGAGPFHATQTSFVWDGLKPNTYYYMRHNQGFSNGAWDPTQTYWILTKNC